MPTGYTAKLCDGDQSFEDFVLSCARAFGPLTFMREDPVDARIPDEVDSQISYYEKAIKGISEDLAHAIAMSPEEAEAGAAAEYEVLLKQFHQSVEKNRLVAARLATMRQKVFAWFPPSPDHENLKKFMLEQLQVTESHEGTCHSSPPVKMPGADWRVMRIQGFANNLRVYSETLINEISKTKNGNKWIKDLRTSLGIGVEKAKP